MLHPGPMVADAPLEIAVEPAAPPVLDEAAAAADPLHHFLRSAWFEAAAGGARIVTLSARRGGGEPVAALPLVTRRLGPLAVRQVPGSYWPCRSFPVARDASEEELAAMIGSREARSALGPAWRLGPIHDDDPTLLRLVGAARRSGWRMLSRRVATCFVIDLRRLAADGPWPGTKRRQRNRWLERRLAPGRQVSYSKVSGSGWSRATLDELAAIEAESWVARKAGLRDAKFLPEAPCRRIWEGVLADPALAGRLTAWLLHVEDEPVAFVFGLDAGGTRHILANGYSERFTEGSPGLLLLYEAFAQTIAEGFEWISWGAGDAGYKSRMSAEPGPAMLDLLFVRSAALAAVAAPFWRRGA